MKLEDKVAVITGGNSGIGLATAKEFRREGARVAILGRSAETLEQARRAIGGEVLAVQGDVCRLPDLDAFFARVKRELGPIDVLVANAGVAKFAPVSVFSEEVFDELCDINFKGAFFTVQKAIPLLRNGASVILVGTAGADQGRMGTSVYAATKAAVRTLARAFSLELLPRRIRVNVLSPGMTETPIIMRGGGMPGMTPEAIAALITQTIPVKRRATAEEMAKAMLFLASADSSYFVGAELMPDGGLTELVTG